MSLFANTDHFPPFLMFALLFLVLGLTVEFWFIAEYLT